MSPHALGSTPDVPRARALARLLRAAFAASAGLALAAGLAKGEPEPRRQEIVLTITGMTCAETCPARVESALESVVGVESASVAYDTRTVRVVYLGRIEPEALVAALRKQGFGAAAP